MRAPLFLLGLVALPCFGCGDPHESSPVNLRVLVSTVGVDQDGDYVLRAGDGSTHHIRSPLLLFLPPGEQGLVLDGDSRTAAVVPGEISVVRFDLTCERP